MGKTSAALIIASVLALVGAGAYAQAVSQARSRDPTVACATMGGGANVICYQANQPQAIWCGKGQDGSGPVSCAYVKIADHP